MVIEPRNEKKLEAFLKIAEVAAQEIGTKGYAPEMRANEMVRALEHAELILYRPQEELNKAPEHYVARMEAIVKRAFERADVRRERIDQDCYARDIGATYMQLNRYVRAAGLEIKMDF